MSEGAVWRGPPSPLGGFGGTAFACHWLAQPKLTRGEWQAEVSEGWCGRGDSNPHTLASASPSSWCVCQFRHFRERGLSRRLRSLLLHRRGGRRCRRCRRRGWRGGRLDAAHDRTRTLLPRDGQPDRPDHEQHGQHRRGPRQHASRPDRAPNTVWLLLPPNALAMSPARPCWSRTTTRRKQADQHVHGNRQDSRASFYYTDLAAPVTIAKNDGTVRLAPPTSAPSTSGESHQVLDVVGFHAAAVEDVALRRQPRAPNHCRSRAADVRVRLAGLRRRRVAAGADGPHRLVGDDERRRPAPA